MFYHCIYFKSNEELAHCYNAQLEGPENLAKETQIKVLAIMVLSSLSTKLFTIETHMYVFCLRIYFT